MTPDRLLTQAVADDPARPLITFYDDSTGERVELSVVTFANWVAKTANLLVDGLGASPGSGCPWTCPRTGRQRSGTRPAGRPGWWPCPGHRGVDRHIDVAVVAVAARGGGGERRVPAAEEVVGLGWARWACLGAASTSRRSSRSTRPRDPWLGDLSGRLGTRHRAAGAAGRRQPAQRGRARRRHDGAPRALGAAPRRAHPVRTALRQPAGDRCRPARAARERRRDGAVPSGRLGRLAARVEAEQVSAVAGLPEGVALGLPRLT